VKSFVSYIGVIFSYTRRTKLDHVTLSSAINAAVWWYYRGNSTSAR